MSTPYETAMRFMRQRDTTTGHPDFIVAYLREEAEESTRRLASGLDVPPELLQFQNDTSDQPYGRIG